MRLLLTLPVLISLSAVRGHCDDWPEWLRTGELLNMGLNYSSQTPGRLGAFVGMRCRLMLGGAAWVAGWGAPASDALRGYDAMGLKAIAYTTPHTIYGDAFFDGEDPAEGQARSRDWLAVGASGEPLRPWGVEDQRYLACVNQPGWRAYCADVVRRFADIGAAGAFYDDALPFGCYCPRCRAAFREWLGSRYGAEDLAAMGVTDAEVPPPPAVRMCDMRDCKTQLDREWVAFAAWSLEQFIAEMKTAALARSPRFVFSANSSQPGVTSCMVLSQETMDLWVYEEGPHSLAPQNNNSLRYLQGFARAKEKPVEMIACGDGWGHEKATPVQYAASIAEAVACGGEMMVHLGHDGEDDEMWRKNPENAATITRYREFFDRHSSPLKGLRSAARVAIFDSNASAMYDSEYYARLRQLSGGLQYGGIPWTVINSEVSSDLLGHFDAVIANWTQVLSDAQVQALRAYASAGGQLLCIGPVGRLDERWRPREAPLPGALEQIPDQVALSGLLDAVAARGPRLIAPQGTRVQLHAWEKGAEGQRSLVLHVLNYTLTGDEADLVPASGLRLALPRPMPHDVLFESPDGPLERLQPRSTDRGCELDLPQVAVYGLVTVRWR